MIDTTNALNAYAASKADALKNLNKNDAALKKQTDAFESVIVKQMLDIALDEKYSIFPDAAGKQIYKSMYTDTLSNALAGNFGYSDMLFNFLKERL